MVTKYKRRSVRFAGTKKKRSRGGTLAEVRRAARAAWPKARVHEDNASPGGWTVRIDDDGSSTNSYTKFVLTMHPLRDVARRMALAACETAAGCRSVSLVLTPKKQLVTAAYETPEDAKAAAKRYSAKDDRFTAEDWWVRPRGSL